MKLRMSIAIVRATHQCIRGSRTPKNRMSQHPQWKDGAGLCLFYHKADHKRGTESNKARKQKIAKKIFRDKINIPAKKGVCRTKVSKFSNYYAPQKRQQQLGRRRNGGNSLCRRQRHNGFDLCNCGYLWLLPILISTWRRCLSAIESQAIGIAIVNKPAPDDENLSRVREHTSTPSSGMRRGDTQCPSRRWLLS